MSGITLNTAVIDGILAGAGYSFESINGTINNAYLWTLAVAFIGLAVVVGLVAHLLISNGRRINNVKTSMAIMQNNHDYQMLNNKKYWMSHR